MNTKKHAGGRPPIDPKLKKVTVGVRLPQYVLDFIRCKKVNISEDIERYYKTKYEIKLKDGK